MANDVKIRFRDYLPGAGVDAAGGAKQGKTRVVGHINVTDYERGGEPLTAIELGVTAIDCLHLRVREEAKGPDAHVRRGVVYSASAEQFYLFDISRVGLTEHYADEDTETLEFDVFGDSAHDVELL
jgi:hypothetical protein